MDEGILTGLRRKAAAYDRLMERLQGDELLEELAALEHDQWSHWTRYFLDTLHNLINLVSTPCDDEDCDDFGCVVRRKGFAVIERWRRQIGTPYEALSEQEKESDRVWARKVRAVLLP